MSFIVQKAEREQLIGSIGLIGPSGSGKTVGALKIAKGMMDAKYPDLDNDKKWEKVGFIDTEHKRSKVYANMEIGGERIGSFLHIDFQKPYTIDRLDEAMKVIKEFGAEVIVIDSTSHFWEGDSGLLDLQNKMGGNFQAWAKVNPHYQQFISLTTGEKYELDVISCIRAKQSHEVSTSETGKLKVEKLGLKPVQRDSLEYEFHIVFNVNMDHIAETSKDNSGLFEGTPQVITSEVGNKIHGWLKEGKDVKAEENAERQTLLSHLDTYAEHDVEIATYLTNMEQAIKKKGIDGFEKLPLNKLRDLVVATDKKMKEVAEDESKQAD